MNFIRRLTSVIGRGTQPSSPPATPASAVVEATQQEAFLGRWTRPMDRDSRERRALTLAALLGLKPALSPGGPLLITTAEECQGGSYPDDVIFAVPGIVVAQARLLQPAFILIDEVALQHEPWGLPGRGPHQQTVEEIHDLCLFTQGPTGPVVVRVRTGSVDEAPGPYGLESNYQQLRRSVTLEIQAASVTEALEALMTKRPSWTWSPLA